MKISVNGAGVETSAQTLAELLAEKGLAEAKLATAVNENFVPTALRAATPLSAGDRVEIVAPQQGG